MKLFITLLLALSLNTADANSSDNTAYTKPSEKLGGLDREVNFLCDYSEIPMKEKTEEFVMCTPVGNVAEAVVNAIYIPVEAFDATVEIATECGDDVPVVGHVVCGAAGFALGAVRGTLKTLLGIIE